MLRSLLSRSSSPAINTLRSPSVLSHPRRNLLLVTKPQRTALVPSPTPSEPGPSTPSSPSSPALRNFRSHSLEYGRSSLSPRRYAPRSVYLSPNNVRAFHSTPRNQINPLPILGALLKVSVAQHVSRLIQNICTDLVSETLAAS